VAAKSTTLLDSTLERVCRFMRRFVIMTEEQAVAVTLWSAMTHEPNRWDPGRAIWDAVPYLLVTSPTPEAGKTLLTVDVLGEVVARPWQVVDPSSATLFRRLDAAHPTVLLDEADGILESRTVRAVLNSGYKRNGAVPRVESVEGVRFVVDYSTFGPKAIAGISGPQPLLHATTLGRSVPIRLQRRMPRERVEKFRRSHVREESQRLRTEVERLIATSAHALAAHEPEMPGVLGDRQQELWLPLLAIADIAGGHWPEGARVAAVALSGEPVQDEGAALIRDIREVWMPRRAEEAQGTLIPPDNPPDRMFSEDLLRSLRLLEDPAFEGGYAAMKQQDLARRLRPFGIAPKPMRIGRDTKRGYELEWFRDAFRRYADVEAQRP
jgi:uncharacterized protein DUF3631